MPHHRPVELAREVLAVVEFGVVLGPKISVGPNAFRLLFQRTQGTREQKVGRDRGNMPVCAFAQGSLRVETAALKVLADIASHARRLL